MQTTIRAIGSDGAVLQFAAPTALDTTNGDSLRAQLVELSLDYDRVILDLSEVTFIDSSALGAFVSLHRRLTQKGGELKLCGLRPGVAMILQVTRLDKVFAVYDSLSEAEASV